MNTITKKLADALREAMTTLQNNDEGDTGPAVRAREALAAYDAHHAGTGSAPAGEHTAEPWQVTAYQKNALTIVSDDYVQNGIIAVVNAGRNYRHPQADANARRIVACVNACAGLADPVAALAALRGLIPAWEARSRDALPADAMLINKHARELREALDSRGGR